MQDNQTQCANHRTPPCFRVGVYAAGPALVPAVNNLPAHNRRHNLPRKLPAIKRSIARQRPRLGGFKGPALLGVENGYVGEVAAFERSASAEIKNAGGSGSKKLDNARQRNL